MSSSVTKKIKSRDDLLSFLQLKPRLSEKISTFNAKEFNLESEKFIDKLATELSALANNGGGTIFIGITASRRVLKELSPVNAELFSPIHQGFLSDKINPELKFEINTIEIEQKNSVIVLHVESQAGLPYMAPDNRFYKKQDYNTVLLNENELRGLYLRGSMPKVEFYAIQNPNGIPTLENGRFKIVNFYPRFLIKNSGNEIEATYKIELHVPTAINNQNFDSLQRYFSRMESHNTVYSIPNSDPLFQNELATAIDANFMITADNYRIFKEMELKIKIYYSKGMNESSVNLLTSFLYKGNILKQEDFVPNQGLEEATVISIAE